MEGQTFEIDTLEKKIDQVLSLINRLEKENSDLKQKNIDLQKKIEQKENLILEIREESQSYDQMKEQVNTYQENQTRIRNKVEHLLEKLKDFDQIE